MLKAVWQNRGEFLQSGRRPAGRFWWLWPLLLCLLGACAAPPSPPPAAGGPAGRPAWAKLARVTALKATGVLSWEAADGRHGKNRVRIFLEPPAQLKIQWLTPWGSVAGQLLVRDGHFWLSDARHRQTWYGRTAALADCFPGRSEVDWASAGRFLEFWPLLFSLPDEDEELAPGSQISYGGSWSENRLTKKLRLADGERVEIALEELESGPREESFARRFSVNGSGGRVDLELRNYRLPERLPDDTFVYRNKNFNLYPCMEQ